MTSLLKSASIAPTHDSTEVGGTTRIADAVWSMWLQRDIIP
jgi:hypothetical protein